VRRRADSKSQPICWHPERSGGIAVTESGVLSYIRLTPSLRRGQAETDLVTKSINASARRGVESSTAYWMISFVAKNDYCVGEREEGIAFCVSSFDRFAILRGISIILKFQKWEISPDYHSMSPHQIISHT
jgi:hypothetical protein